MFALSSRRLYRLINFLVPATAVRRAPPRIQPTETVAPPRRAGRRAAGRAVPQAPATAATAPPPQVRFARNPARRATPTPATLIKNLSTKFILVLRLDMFRVYFPAAAMLSSNTFAARRLPKT